MVASDIDKARELVHRYKTARDQLSLHDPLPWLTEQIALLMRRARAQGRMEVRRGKR